MGEGISGTAKFACVVVAIGFVGLLFSGAFMAVLAVFATVVDVVFAIFHDLRIASYFAVPLSAATLILLVLWRRSFPFRATRLLTTLIVGKSKASNNSQRPRLRWMWRSGHVWRIAWKMPAGVTVANLRHIQTAFEEGLDCSVRWYYERGMTWMEAGTAPLPERVDFDEFYRETPPGGELVVGIGMSRIGKLWIDVAELPHLLCGGVARYGKTGFLRQMLAGLVLRMTPAELQLVLIDFKQIEFNTFESVPHLFAPVVGETEDAEIALGRVVAEVERRRGLFKAARVANIVAWNKQNPNNRLPYLLVVVDEYAELRPAEAPTADEREGRKAVLAHLSRLARLSRAFGGHLVLSTQRPDSETVGGQVKAQTSATVAFYCRDDTNSRILLDNSTAADLPPSPGRGIWQWDKQVQFQGPWLEKEDAEMRLALAFPARPVDVVPVDEPAVA